MLKVRNSVSKRNKWYLPKHRYLELYHFCLQYSDWKKLYYDLSYVSSGNGTGSSPGIEWSDPTSNLASMRELYFNNMKLVEQTAIAADSDLYQYLIKGITEERSYENLSLAYGIPCCKDTYYDRYRKFFWLLDKSQNKHMYK